MTQFTDRQRGLMARLTRTAQHRARQQIVSEHFNEYQALYQQYLSELKADHADELAPIEPIENPLQSA